MWNWKIGNPRLWLLAMCRERRFLRTCRSKRRTMSTREEVVVVEVEGNQTPVIFSSVCHASDAAAPDYSPPRPFRHSRAFLPRYSACIFSLFCRYDGRENNSYLSHPWLISQTYLRRRWLRTRSLPLPLTHCEEPPMFASHRTDSTFEEIPIMLVFSSTHQVGPFVHNSPLTSLFSLSET